MQCAMASKILKPHMSDLVSMSGLGDKPAINKIVQSIDELLEIDESPSSAM